MTRLLAMHSMLQINAGQAGDTPGLPRFSMVAYTGGKMVVGGWEYPVVVDLAGMEIPTQRIPIQASHDMAAGVGHTEEITVVDGQLLAEGIISRGTPFAQEVVLSSRNGFPWQASMGTSVLATEFLPKGESAEVNGQLIEGPASIARKSVIDEISFVPLGADNKTTASVAARKAEKKGREMPELKERRAALIQAHGERHTGLILAALVDGKDDAEISEEITTATAEEMAAEMEALKQSIIEKDAEIASLKERLGISEDALAASKATRTVPGNLGQHADHVSASWYNKPRRKMTESEKADALSDLGAEEYKKLPL